MRKQVDGQVSEAEKHHLIGNALCLDFANTLYGHNGTPLHEYLYSYRDLVVWSRRAGILDARHAEKLIHLGERQPDQARCVFQQAIALRETIFRIFAALANGRAPKSLDIGMLNAARSEALTHSTINRTTDGFVLDWNDETALDSMLWEIAISAGDLLTSERANLVRECNGDTCDWLFVDTSRNHMRRWCSMRICGNRAKARRFLQKRRVRTAVP